MNDERVRERKRERLREREIETKKQTRIMKVLKIERGKLVRLG